MWMLMLGLSLAAEPVPSEQATEPAAKRVDLTGKERRAQDDKTLSKGWTGPTVSAAYRSHGAVPIHPGVATRLTWTGWRKDRDRIAKKTKLPLKHRSRDLFLGAELYGETHLTSSTFVGVQGLAGTRVVRARGYMTGWTLGLGGQRSFLNHPSWWVDDEGTPRKAIGAGQFSGIISLSTEWGWDVQRRREWRERSGKNAHKALAHAFQWFIRPQIHGLLGWNNAPFPVPGYSIDFGVRAPLAALRRSR